ncbi:MAG: FAD-dependent oxidoreductase [Thalassobaculum sp.]|uniref:GcvT family protein n=1 Tax=Thalassobaculum sp. TaxID=2022740 RepID=UPI0032F0727F
MKTQARVVVIGGGVVGCSVLYHLTKLGWTDVMLIERSELTSGSTWHAAGGMHTLNSDPNVAKLQDYTIRLYKEIEEISGQSCGVHMTGGFMLAATPERLDYLKTARAKARVLGMDTELVGMEEVGRQHPLIDTSHFLGALWDPNEGHVDPSGVTHAYAKAARLKGAEIVLRNPVKELVATSDGHWQVVTEQGTVTAEIVINAGGLWAREVGRMVGIELPVLAMEHHYLITEEIPEIVAYNTERGREMPHAIDFEAELYSRQEGKGMVIGTYEKACVPWSPKDTPWDFGHELLQPDFDRIAPSLDLAFRHFPPLAKAGIKQAINGPFTFAPDGNPLVGPVPGLRNFWCACGVMAGFSQGGGVGLMLAQWLIEGEPEMDIFAMDVGRFGDIASRAFTRAKVQENSSRRFSITFPNEELPVARPLRTTPAYDLLKSKGAVFGAAVGLEHALWFAPDGEPAVEATSFRRSNAFGPTGVEAKAVRETVGVLEIANFAKHEISGSGAEAFLDRILAGRLPRPGRMALSPMLSPKGRLLGDLTVSRLSDDRFLIVGSAAAQEVHQRWFADHAPASGVSLRNRTRELAGFAIAGPNSRALLARLTDEDISNGAFPFRSIRRLDIGHTSAWVARISYTGELGYEIYAPFDHQRGLLLALLAAGEGLGVRLFGGRALNALRLEKGFGAWLREFTPGLGPVESGLDRFIADKPGYIGRDAYLAARDAGSTQTLALLEIDATDADAWRDEPIDVGDRTVGFVTSGGYGYAAGRSLALAYIDTGFLNEPLEVEILGERKAARVLAEPPIDPTGSRMRG